MTVQPSQPSQLSGEPQAQAGALTELVSSDKDLSRVHSAWLGPPNFTLPFAIPYASAGAAFIAFVIALPLTAIFGLGGLWHYFTAAALAVAAAVVVSRNRSSDRGALALIAILWHEASAPRPARPATPHAGSDGPARPRRRILAARPRRNGAR